VSSRVSVFKLGGSVLHGASGYQSAAGFLATTLRSRPGQKVVAVVSAEYGHTDLLAREAEAMSGGAPDQETLDLLWSTGETRSVALLTFALRAEGVAVTALGVHEAGLRLETGAGSPVMSTLWLRAALARYAVVVVPGFLAVRNRRAVTLGRGGSDLSAVLIAAALDADECVLVKDVDGFYSADPATTLDARQLPHLTFEDALAMADAGCPLVQRQALGAAQSASLSIVVRAVSGTGTAVTQ
jgi:aspartate kinase